MGKKSLILAVDHNRRNLEILSQVLSREGFQTLTATDTDEFDHALSRIDEIALALIDVSGFNNQIWERVTALREVGVPFLVISPRQMAAVQQASIQHGARGVLVKPLVAKEFLGLVHSLLEA